MLNLSVQASPFRSPARPVPHFLLPGPLLHFLGWPVPPEPVQPERREPAPALGVPVRPSVAQRAPPRLSVAHGFHPRTLPETAQQHFLLEDCRRCPLTSEGPVGPLASVPDVCPAAGGSTRAPRPPAAWGKMCSRWPVRVRGTVRKPSGLPREPGQSQFLSPRQKPTSWASAAGS